MITKTSRLYRIVVILIVFIMVTLTGCNEMSGFASFKLLDDYKNVSDDVISENDRIALKWNEKEKLVYLRFLYPCHLQTFHVLYNAW